MFIFARFRHVPSAAVVAVVIAALACEGGSEGDRCNPDLSHNDCNGALTCQQPATCVENYCCPTPASASSNPFCNGSACPAVDAGSGDAATSDASAGLDADAAGLSADASGTEANADAGTEANDGQSGADASDASSAADGIADAGAEAAVDGSDGGGAVDARADAGDASNGD